MTILAMVNADKEGQIESRMMKARQMEEIREARREEAKARQEQKKSKLVSGHFCLHTFFPFFIYCFLCQWRGNKSPSQPLLSIFCSVYCWRCYRRKRRIPFVRSANRKTVKRRCRQPKITLRVQNSLKSRVKSASHSPNAIRFVHISQRFDAAMISIPGSSGQVWFFYVLLDRNLCGIEQGDQSNRAAPVECRWSGE